MSESRSHGRVANLWVMCLMFMALTPTTGAVELGDYYPFNFPWDYVPPFSNDVDRLTHDTPAGDKGRVVVRGDELFFEDGSPARFWGVGIRITDNIPPADPALRTKLLDRLRGFGVNHIRLIGWDFNEPGMFKQWLTNGASDKKDMERVCAFIEEAGKKGIYFSASFNHISGKFGNAYADLHNKDFPSNKSLKYVQLYDERIVSVIERWFGYLLDKRHPGCTKRLVDYAHFVYLEAVNEDSIFQAFNRDFVELSPAAKDALNKKFGTYLKAKYHKLEAVTDSWGQNVDGLGENYFPVDDVWAYPVPGKSMLLGASSEGLVVDVQVFLADIDKSFAKRVKTVVRTAGFRGLFSVTNNWYGYGSLAAVSNLGDIIEMHGYFDPPRKKKMLGRKFITQANDSYVNAPVMKKELVQEGKSHIVMPLLRLFVAALDSKPLIISEWNQGGFSDYVYEGPLLMTAYASLHGVRGLDLHTYISFGETLQQTTSHTGFSVAGNPVMLALMPSLSVAFVNSYIKEDLSPVYVTESESWLDYWRKSLQNGDWVANLNNKVDLSLGFEQKIRKTLVGRSSKVPLPSLSTDGRWEADTGEIVWDWSDGRTGLLTVDAERFQATTGAIDGKAISLGALEVQLDTPASVTAVSLDDEVLSISRSVLVTAVSGFRNNRDEMQDIAIPLMGYLRVVKKPGVGPPQMKKVTGKLGMKTRLRGDVTVTAITPNREISVRARCTPVNEKVRLWKFDVSRVEALWFHLKIGQNEAVCS